MAYAESTVGGTYGGSFRVWVNSILTYRGGPSENFEEWRAEGGLNRVSTSGGHIWDGYNESTFTLQLGLNGMAASGRYSYDFGGGTGRMLAWGTGTTRVYRDGAGNGFGFQSRMDINLTNSPYLTSGWVTANDGVATIYRHATLTALSMDAGGITAYDEGPMWLEFSNPSGTAVDAWIEAPPGGGNRVSNNANVGSRFNFSFAGTLPALLQQASPNSNSQTLRIGIHDSMGGDSWDYRDRTYYIKNDTGQANPIFSDFAYLDTNSATVAVTGSNQYLVQGKSTLQVNITTANKAMPRKYATMVSYNDTIGGYVNNLAYSSSATVTDNVGIISDVTGTQSLSVRAIDSRSNSTTVSKNVLVVPYASPYFVPTLSIGYTNNYDNTGGLTVSVGSGSTIAFIAPMTISNVDKNSVNTTSGVKFDMSKSNNTTYTGTKVNVAITQTATTGAIQATLSTLATAILTKMNAMGADNTVRWYIKFEITDKLETQTYETFIDVGKAVFRIGYDGRVYNQEVVLMPSHVGMVIMSTTLSTASAVQNLYGGTWAAFGAGRVPVGFNSSDSDFTPVEKTGGQKDVQSHSHAIYPYNDDFNNSAGGTPYGTTFDGTTTPLVNSIFKTQNAGTGTTNMNPYIVVYMWKRTA